MYHTFLAVFTGLLNGNWERIYNQEERQMKYQGLQHCSDVTAVNVANYCSEVNRIVHILFCLKEHKVLLQCFNAEFLPLTPAHVLLTSHPKKPTRIMHWIWPHILSAEQKGWLKTQLSTCFLSETHTRVSTYFWNYQYSNLWPHGYTCSCWTVGINIFLPGCVQRGTNTSLLQRPWRSLYLFLETFFFAIC